MELTTYSKIISKYFKGDASIPEFVDQFYPNENRDTKIRTIRRYCSGEVVPSYPTARDLLDKLGEEYSEEDLIDILNVSKTSKESTAPSPFIDKLTIKYKEIFADRLMVPRDKDLLLRERINATTESGTLKEYIIKLIEHDVDNIALSDIEEEDK